jgi:hypothetical protein
MSDDQVTIHGDFSEKLHQFPVVQAGTRAIAVAIAERAREMAPVESGDYKNGIVVDPPNKKGVARVYSQDPKSSWIEFGTSQQPGLFVIRSATESLGYKFKTKGE